MAKHRSHIVRPILAESKAKINSGFDFVFSDDVQRWMHGSKYVADRKFKDKAGIRKQGIVNH
jgi:hypothetical protein